MAVMMSAKLSLHHVTNSYTVTAMHATNQAGKQKIHNLGCPLASLQSVAFAKAGPESHSRSTSFLTSSFAPPRKFHFLSAQGLPNFPVSLCIRGLSEKRKSLEVRAEAYGGGKRRFAAATGYAPQYTTEEDPEEANKRALVSRRLESTARYFRRLGAIGFWGQLICSIVAAVILAFSVVVTGTATAPVTTYLACAGIAAGFLSTFWSYGYMRLANRLRSVVNNPSKAPPRATVVDNLKNGLMINILGTGSTLLGLQATVGLLVAKALTSSYQPFSIGAPAGYSPVLALDVFLVQASANTLLCHFIGMVLSLELLRALTLQQPPPDSVMPKPA